MVVGGGARAWCQHKSRYLPQCRPSRLVCYAPFLPICGIERECLRACADREEVPKRWFPFAEGTRNCVGKSLAQVTLPATLAILLARFSFRLADEVRPVLTCISSWLLVNQNCSVPSLPF